MVRVTIPRCLTAFAIAIGLIGPPSSRADDFQWETMVHYWIRMNRDFEYSDKRIDSYMQAFRPQQWNKVRNNEAIIDDARKELKKLMEERAKDVKLDATFTLHLPMRFGDHDNDMPGFPIVQMSESTYWMTGGNRYTQALPSQFHLYFRNTQQFNSLPMTKLDAGALMTRRTNDFGSIDRTVYVILKCKIVKLKSTSGEFLADIEEATAFEDAAKTKKLGMLTSASKATPAKK
jgi:Domain of unknown function (DUF4852)